MKILVLSESINAEDSSGSKVNFALVRNLIKAGFEVKVYHYSYKEILVAGVESILIKENKFSIWYVLSRIQRKIQVAFNINFNNLIEPYLGFSFAHTSDTNSIAKAIKAETSFNPDLILTLSKGGSFRPHRALLKLPHLHSKWIAYIHDPYPFHYYPRPYNWVEKSYRSKQKLTEDVFSSARYISYPSQLLMEWMESYFEAGKGKGFVIPHQIGDDATAHEFPDYFDTSGFNLLHAGNLLKQRNPEFLIKGFLKFLDQNPPAVSVAKLLIVGPNEYHKEYLKQFENHFNVIVKGHLDYASVKLLEKSTSVNIILEAVSEISPFLPGKFPNLVIADKPLVILGPYYSELRRILGDDYLYWSEADNVSKISQLFENLFNNWKENEKTTLNRQDLAAYCSEQYLKKVFSKQFNTI